LKFKFASFESMLVLIMVVLTAYLGAHGVIGIMRRLAFSKYGYSAGVGHLLTPAVPAFDK
jgi:hypothetical protein